MPHETTTNMNNNPQKRNNNFELKGSLFTLTVFHLLKADLTNLSSQLAELIRQTPKFFHHMPIVIDLQRLPKTDLIIDFPELISILKEHLLIPVGVRGGAEEQASAAIAVGLAVLPNTKTDLSDPPPPSTQQATAPTDLGAKIITHPVRSGQQIYARKADLIVLAPVSPGAELLADGNIHVYGHLRGRALAGVMGNQNCRIFCHHLEAELVSIAGHYWVNEDLQNVSVKQNAHIYLENDKLHIAALL